MFAGIVSGGLFWEWHSDRLGCHKPMQIDGAMEVVLSHADLLHLPGLSLGIFIMLLFAIGVPGMSTDFSFAAAKEMFTAPP